MPVQLISQGRAKLVIVEGLPLGNKHIHTKHRPAP